MTADHLELSFAGMQQMNATEFLPKSPKRQSVFLMSLSPPLCPHHRERIERSSPYFQEQRWRRSVRRRRCKYHPNWWVCCLCVVLDIEESVSNSPSLETASTIRVTRWMDIHHYCQLQTTTSLSRKVQASRDWGEIEYPVFPFPMKDRPSRLTDVWNGFMHC